jgi:hypothetical protein
MTDRQKIKHAIAVLKTLEDRVDLCMVGGVSTECEFLHNIRDLSKLLEKPHVTEKKEPGHAGPTWDDALQLAQRLRNHILKRKPNMRKFDLVAWTSEMDRIIRIDNRPPSHMAELIDWCQQDNFWQNNILSPSKLRKQLDRLELQMSSDYHWQKNKLRRRVQDGPTAKEKYMEKLNANSQGTDG